jgi:signal transduction histidine kinase
MTDDWVRPKPGARGYRTDAIAAVLLAVGAATSAMLYSRVGYFDDPAPVWVSVIAIAFETLPLALRRRFPLAIAIVVSLAFFAIGQLLVPELLFSNITLFLAIYTLGAWGQRRRVATIARIVIIVGMFVWIAVNLIITVSDPEHMPDVSRSGIFSQFASVAVIQVITNALYFGGAYYFGNTAFRAARERAELESRTAELTAERERSAAQAVALDRVRIARELHDVVAHHVSVMGVQAGAARRVIDSDPVAASGALSTIEKSAREAVDELHGLLTTLRESDLHTDDGRADDGGPTIASTGGTSSASTSSSTRGLDQLDELVSESEAAGVPAKMLVIGSKRPVTTLTGFTIYRVAQEALTNVRKHAGSRATVEVRVRYLDDGVELEVADTGVGATPSAAGGLGLLGMRERVSAVGGVLETGPRSRGGFIVRASVPDLSA